MTKKSGNREINFSLPDLVDRLTIDQIKQIQFEKTAKNYEKSINQIMKSIDRIIIKKKIKISDQLISVLLNLSQINLYIWFLRKDLRTQKKPNSKKIKLSHQLNALRNQLKNRLSNLCFQKKSNSIEKKTNTNKEDLKGWKLNSLND